MFAVIQSLDPSGTEFHRQWDELKVSWLGQRYSDRLHLLYLVLYVFSDRYSCVTTMFHRHFATASALTSTRAGMAERSSTSMYDLNAPWLAVVFAGVNSTPLSCRPSSKPCLSHTLAQCYCTSASGSYALCHSSLQLHQALCTRSW